jgi:hypothetical protein
MGSDKQFQMATRLNTAVVLISSDYGVSWTSRATTGIATCCATSISGNFMYLGTATNIYQSTNLGANWTPIYSCNSTSMACSSNGAIIIAGTIGLGIIRSANGGGGWTSNATNLNCHDVCINDAGDKCYGVGYSGAISTTGLYFYWTGSSFASSMVSVGLESRRAITCNKGSGDVVSIYGYNLPSYYSQTGTISTSFLTSNIPTGTYVSASSNTLGTIHMVVNSNGTIFRSTNYGADFSQMTIGSSSLSCVVLDSQGSDGLAADDTELYQYTIDSVNPAPTGLVPFGVLTATSVSALVLTFNENIVKNTSGDVRIYVYSNSTTPVDTIPIVGTSILNDTLTITPNITFTPGERYYINIDAGPGAILDNSNNSFGGFAA